MVGEGQETVVLVESASNAILSLQHACQSADIMADGKTTSQRILPLLYLLAREWYDCVGALHANEAYPSREKEHPVVIDRIEINPDIMLGKPVIRGTRIPVELILRKLSEGATEANLLDAYPRLTQADIHAALAYAADSVAHETILLQTS